MSLELTCHLLSRLDSWIWVSLSLIVFCKEDNIGERGVRGTGRQYWIGRIETRRQYWKVRSERDRETILQRGKSARDRMTILAWEECDGQEDDSK